MNEFFVKGTEFPKPWSVQLELTEGCNRSCHMCGIHSLYRTKEERGKYRFMTVDTARRIAKDLNDWLGKIRLEFALQGEPLLNPDYLEIFQAFRNHFPKAQIMVTSNMDVLKRGSGFDSSKILQLFKAGVNILVADYYGEKTDMTYQQFLSSLKSTGITTYDFYEDKPKVWAYVGNEVQYIVSIDNTFDRNFHRSLNNQAGNTSPDLIRIKGYKIDAVPMAKRCHLPFREMPIKHDGAVEMCCMDWQREAIMGKFPDVSFKEIWNGVQFMNVRKMLYEKRRDLLSPCDRCNYHPVKVGLIQNPFESKEEKEQLITIGKDYFKRQKESRHLANKYADKPFKYTEDIFKTGKEFKDYKERLNIK